MLPMTDLTDHPVIVSAVLGCSLGIIGSAAVVCFVIFMMIKGGRGAGRSVIPVFRAKFQFSESSPVHAVLRQIHFMAICDLTGSICILISLKYVKVTGTCAVLGALTQFAFLSSFLWMGLVGVMIIANVQRVLGRVSSSKWEFRQGTCHAIAWGTTIVLGLIPLIGNQYGNAGAWCWIKDPCELGLLDTAQCHWKQFLYRFLPFYLPLTLIWLFLVGASIWAIHCLRFKMPPEYWTSDTNKVALKATIGRMLIFPCMFVLLVLPGFINRVLEAAGTPSIGCACWQALSMNATGLFNAVFGFNGAFRRSVAVAFESLKGEVLMTVRETVAPLLHREEQFHGSGERPSRLGISTVSADPPS